MKKAIIYMPNKNPMQSGLSKNKWILEYKTKDPTKNPLMGWESSSDTFTEIKLEFSSKDLAINYAKKKKIDFELIEQKKRKIIKKSPSPVKQLECTRTKGDSEVAALPISSTLLIAMLEARFANRC